MARYGKGKWPIAFTMVVTIPGCSRPAHYEPVPCQPAPSLAHPMRVSSSSDVNGALSGIVRNDATEQPLANAIVLLRPGRQAVRADSAGRFKFVGVAPGRHFIEARQVGYRIRGDSLNVPEHLGVRVDLWLDPIPTDECGAVVTLVPRRPWWKFW